MNLSALSKRLDRLDRPGNAAAYQSAWDRFCLAQSWPRLDVGGASGIEALLRLYRAEPEAEAWPNS